jgi:phage shock protein PspC (stress-responsive transcriptional regulator)
MISIMLILDSDLNVHPVQVSLVQFVSSEAVESRLHRAFCLRLHLGQFSLRRAHIPWCTSRMRRSKFAIDACKIEIKIVEGILAGASLYFQVTLTVVGIRVIVLTVEQGRLSPLFVSDHR